MKLNSKQRESIADYADNVLTLISELDRSNGLMGRYARKESDRIKPYLVGCDYHLLEPDLPQLVNWEHGIFGNDNPDVLADAVFPIDYATCLYKEEEGGYHIFYRLIGPISRHEIKTKIRSIPVTLMCRMYRARVYLNNTWWAEEAILGMVDGRWTNMEAGIVHKYRNGLETEKMDLPELNRNAALMCAMALTSRYDWHVAIGSETGTRLLLPSSPQGCLALLRDREKDGTRRAALRHWVQEHYRERTEFDLSYVRKHLRGKTKFEWHGQAGEIYVSKYDLERNEFFKNQADEWRAARKHNQPHIRVRLKGLRP
jgi:hypothetical protein